MRWLDNRLLFGNEEYEALFSFENVFFPNPFHHHFSFKFDLNRESEVSLYLMNPFNGNIEKEFLNELTYPQGKHIFSWSDEKSLGIIKNGVYFLVFEEENMYRSIYKVIKN